MLTTRIVPVEPKPPLPKTLADVGPFVLCVLNLPEVGEVKRWHDGLGKVWGSRFGAMPISHTVPPNRYEVLKVIGPFVFPTDGTEVKVEPPKPRTLDQLEPWEFATVEYGGLIRNGSRCHDGCGGVYCLRDRVPVPLPIRTPSDYTVIKSLGRLEIGDKEEELDDA